MAQVENGSREDTSLGTLRGAVAYAVVRALGSNRNQSLVRLFGRYVKKSTQKTAIPRE